MIGFYGVCLHCGTTRAGFMLYCGDCRLQFCGCCLKISYDKEVNKIYTKCPGCGKVMLEEEVK